MPGSRPGLDVEDVAAVRARAGGCSRGRCPSGVGSSSSGIGTSGIDRRDARPARCRTPRTWRGSRRRGRSTGIAGKRMNGISTRSISDAQVLAGDRERRLARLVGRRELLARDDAVHEHVRHAAHRRDDDHPRDRSGRGSRPAAASSAAASACRSRRRAGSRCRSVPLVTCTLSTASITTCAAPAPARPGRSAA